MMRRTPTVTWLFGLLLVLVSCDVMDVQFERVIDAGRLPEHDPVVIRTQAALPPTVHVDRLGDLRRALGTHPPTAEELAVGVVVVVAPGVYDLGGEPLNIKAGGLIIDARGVTIRGDDILVEINADNVTLGGMVLQDGRVGIQIDNSRNVFISDTLLQRNDVGVRISRESQNITFKDNVIEDGDDYGVDITQSRLITFTNNVIRNNMSGVKVRDNTRDIVFNHNNIIGNRNAGMVTPAWIEPVNARENWWGSPSGPHDAQRNPNGRGDTIEGNVDFMPYAQVPVFESDVNFQIVTFQVPTPTAPVGVPVALTAVIRNVGNEDGEANITLDIQGETFTFNAEGERLIRAGTDFVSVVQVTFPTRGRYTAVLSTPHSVEVRTILVE